MFTEDNQKNLILAIVISVAIVLGWQFLVEGPRLQAQRAAQPPAATTQPAATPAPAATPQATGGAAPSVPAAAAPDRAAAVAQSPRIRIDTPQVKGSIRVVGAQIDDLQLARYRETTDPASAPITLLSPQNSPDPYFAEFGWVAGSASVAVPDGQTPWIADRDTLTATTPVTLTWDNGAGLKFQRRIAIDSNFMFEITDSVANSGSEPVALQAYGRIQRVGTPKTLGFYILHEGPIGVLNGKLEEPSYDDVKKKREIKASATGAWLGITDKYWLVALVPDQKTAKDTRFLHTAAQGKDAYQADFLAGAVTVAPGAGATAVNHLFAGAKEVRLLDAYENSLGVALFDRAVDFGWFYWLTRPIFFVLDFFYRLLGNFGLAILLLTLCVKGLFFPLANKSYRAMSKMKLLQPEIEKLKAIHGGDQAKMSQAMMELYKKSGANPLAGCLPVIIQIPVFFSLYKVLFVTIEMRHAPFYGWIKDLSAGDPTSIFNLFGLLPWGPPEVILLGGTMGAWPLIMGVTMWLQQKMNPAPPDPVQAKIFMFMPILFTFMLAAFPAGLVIYWAWNNILSVAQQWVIMRQTAQAKTAH
ncbi:MAG: membrane protein insertase YidC [Alphaproteobacteria bacterium]|nr:membrane protein insertase YidC [Alphaproteobacteria bacterium]